jgi:hypothetical protein
VRLLTTIIVAFGALWSLGSGTHQAERPFNAFYFPAGLVVDSHDNVYVCGMNHKVIRISPSGIATDFAGSPRSIVGHKDGPAESARFDSPKEMAIDSDDTIYVTERSAIRKVRPSGTVSTMAIAKGGIRDGPLSDAGFRRPGYIAVDAAKNVYVTDVEVDERSQPAYSVIRKINTDGEVTTLRGRDGAVLRLAGARGLAVDGEGNLFVCDTDARCIKRIAPDGSVTVVAGKCGTRTYNPVYRTGDVSTAELMTPRCLIVGRNGELVFSDERANRIVKIAAGRVSTLAGGNVIDTGGANAAGYSKEGYVDGDAKTALFNFPYGIGFDRAGNLFIVDQGNQCVRKLSPDGMVTTFYK